MHENGPGSSLHYEENLMIFHLDGSDKQSIVALFKDTGEVHGSLKIGRAKRKPPTS